jgi:hypothetical protein
MLFRSVPSTLPIASTRRGHRLLLLRGSFLVNFLLRNLPMLVLFWNSLGGEVRHNVAQLNLQTGTIHPRIFVPNVPQRDIL